MNNVFKYFFILLIFLFTGCSVDESSGFSDAEIVEMIIQANKIEISMNDMPEASQSLVDEDYIDYMSMAAKKASGLGYEVDLAGLGHKSGHRNEIYFNLEGRMLDPNDWGDNKRGNKDYFGRYSQEDWSCFELIFPISFNMPDGSVVEVISDDEQGWAIIKSWYESNSGSREKPSMQFPVVIFLEEESITLENSADLRGAYNECNYDRRKNRDGHDRKDPCFEMVYPINFIMPDGSSITVTSDDESGWSELKNWYDNNSGYEEQKPEIEFPINIIYEVESGDSIVNIESEEAMMIAKEACSEEWEKSFKRECFELVFPIEFLMPDGTSMNIESEEDYMDIRNWYLENPDQEGEATLQYPVNIRYFTDASDSIVTVESEEELMRRKEQCWQIDEGDSQCYTYVFPISFTMPDGSHITISSDTEDEWYELRNWYDTNSGYEAEPVLNYPINIIFRDEEGETQVTVNNDEELETASEQNCEDEADHWEEDEGDNECFTFVFPISFTMPDGSSITLNSEAGFRELEYWYESNSEYNGEPSFQYPIDIVFQDESQETLITINSDEELDEAEENCED